MNCLLCIVTYDREVAAELLDAVLSVLTDLTAL